MRRVEVGALTALCLLMPTSGATAQRIVGAIHETASGAAVSGAVVSIIDSAGRAGVRAISNERGRYGVMWPDNGVRMRVVRIGFRPATLSLPKGAPHDTTIDLTMERVPVTLGTVHVSSKPVCSASGEGGAALDLWDQARAALLNSIVARTAMPADAANLIYQQDLDLQTRRVTRQQSRITRGTVMRPFATGIPAAELAAHGYLTVRDGEQTFYGPDPDVLFDDSFTGAHCFGVRSDDVAHRGLVALTFEPRRMARLDSIVDVRGELWIDPKNAVLVQLDFKYTGVDDVAKRAGIGGTIHFQSLSNGVVFIDSWSISLVTLQQISNSRSFRVTKMNESGGFVLAAQWPDSTRHTGRRGAVKGVVTEKGQRGPARNVVVTLDGVDTTVTDQEGKFEFGLLPGGLYSIHLIDTTYQQYNVPRIISGEARVGRGDTVTVSFEVPSHGSVLTDMCQDQNVPTARRSLGLVHGGSLILGQISDGSRQWPRDLHVESTWLSDVPGSGRPGSPVKSAERTLAIDVDDAGRFHICGVQRDRLVRIKVVIGRLPIADTTVILYDSVARIVDWRLPPATFALVQNEASALTGRVLTDGDGKPVPDADVWAPSSDLHARTDSSGQFRLYGLRPGKQIVQVRRIGFSERRDTVTLRGGREVVRDFLLEGTLVLLDTMRTTSPVVAYHKPMLQQFEMRRHTGTGRFIAEDLLRKHDNQSMGQFLAGRMGGITLVGYRSSIFANSIRNQGGLPAQNQGGLPAIPGDSHSPRGCWVALYIDGMPIYTGAPSTNAPDLSTMRVDEYAGLEFYPGGASTPAQFNNTKEANCGVLLLWTREK